MKEKFISYFGKEWYEVLKPMLHSDYFNRVGLFLKDERTKYTVYPLEDDFIFKAFRVTPFDKVKGVILGQDPYHDGSYDGICFSNSTSNYPSPSLRNILNEVNRDIYAETNINRINDYSLYDWAVQGLLMINSAFTVRKGEPASHSKMWLGFTSAVMSALNTKNDLVWMLWGRHAQKMFRDNITNRTHGYIETSHPSPLGANSGDRPFTRSKCFSEFNDELGARNKKEIIW